MGKKIYVGNLAFSVNTDSLTQLFSQYGAVEKVNIITDRDSGRSKGFAFVEMMNASDAQRSIDSLNGQQHEGRAMNISEAKPQAPRENRFGGSRSRY